MREYVEKQIQQMITVALALALTIIILVFFNFKVAGIPHTESLFKL